MGSFARVCYAIGHLSLCFTVLAIYHLDYGIPQHNSRELLRLVLRVHLLAVSAVILANQPVQVVRRHEGHCADTEPGPLVLLVLPPCPSPLTLRVESPGAPPVRILPARRRHRCRRCPVPGQSEFLSFFDLFDPLPSPLPHILGSKSHANSAHFGCKVRRGEAEWAAHSLNGRKNMVEKW